MNIQKIIFLFTILKKIKFTLNQKKIIVFDGVSLPDLEFVLEDRSYFVLEDRLERINRIYLTPSVIYFFFKYLFLITKRYSLKVIYMISIIKSVNPKLILTSIDNSINFFLCAKILKKNFFFIAVQNDYEFAFQGIYNDSVYQKNFKNIFCIPNYVCWGQNEIDGAKKTNINVDKFYKFGSIRLANFLHYLKKNKIIIKKKLYDICFIAQNQTNFNKLYKSKLLEKSTRDLLKFTIKFSMENKCKFIFASRGFLNSDYFKSEIEFYKPALNKKEFDFLLSNIHKRENNFSSQFTMFQSEVAIGVNSTLLFEKIALKEKILSCNMSDKRIFDFPIKGICSMNNYNYDEFCKKLKIILKLKKIDYLKKLEKNPQYIIEFNKDKSVIKKIKELISSKL